MGMHVTPATTLGNVPIYYITDTLQEDAGGGNIRIRNYARVRGVLVPQFECIVASSAMLLIGRTISDFAQDIFNAAQVRLPGMKVH